MKWTEIAQLHRLYRVDPAAATPGTNPGLDPGAGGGGGGTPAPQPEVIDIGGRQITVTDPSLAEQLRAFRGDWVEQQRTLQRYQQQADAYQQQAAQYAALLERALEGRAEPDAPQEPSLTPEQIAERNERLRAEFEQDPAGFLARWEQKVLERAAALHEEALAPITTRLTWQSTTEALAARYPDFSDLAPDMQKVIEAERSLPEEQRTVREPRDLEGLYWRIKATKQTPPNPQDPQFIQAALRDPTWAPLISAAVSDYLKTKAAQGQSVPTVIGGPDAGKPPAAPPDRPKSIDEAHARAKAWFAAQGIS